MNHAFHEARDMAAGSEGFMQSGAGQRPRSPEKPPARPKPVPDRSPFRKVELSDEEADKAYHSKHDLREMYTRENTERRRAGAHTLRRYLTAAQDKLFIARGVKIRDEFLTANNDDVVVVLAQQLMAEGKGADLDPRLTELARKAVIPRRGG